MKYTPGDDLDNRSEPALDVTNGMRYLTFDAIICPHCGLMINRQTVISGHYCYMCGGRFREVAYVVEDETERR